MRGMIRQILYLWQLQAHTQVSLIHQDHHCIQVSIHQNIGNKCHLRKVRTHCRYVVTLFVIIIVDIFNINTCPHDIEIICRGV